MTTEKSPFQKHSMEAAGSLTPELEGSPASSRHPRRGEAPKKTQTPQPKQVRP